MDSRKRWGRSTRLRALSTDRISDRGSLALGERGDVRCARRLRSILRDKVYVLDALKLGQDERLKTLALQHHLEVRRGERALQRRRVDPHAQLGRSRRCRLR